MKKLAVVLAIISIAAVAAPAFSATNPFMDVPMNHWAYDAIGQLAADGILSGYPDGTYKGKQPTTRYEMASALARLLAVVDMTKASKSDFENMRRLVMEFQDELEALGVRVDELDERVAVFENRLGGWHIHGTLVLDVINQSRNKAGDAFGPDGQGSIGFDEARLFFERTWGENDDFFFRARLRDEEGGNGRFDRFYAEMPFFFDTKFTVGRWNWAWEGAYKIDLPEVGGWTGDQILTDWTWTGFGLTKNFGLGTADIAFAHPNNLTYDGFDVNDWMILARATFQFTEQIGFDLGGQAFIGDNAEEFTGAVDANGNRRHAAGDVSFNNLWTIFGGLRFNFNDAIGVKGVFYHQQVDGEKVNATNTGWFDYGYGILDGTSYKDDANHWAAIIDVKQEALKYTSVWLEYGQFDEGFMGMNGGMLFYGGLLQEEYGAGVANFDTKYWRVGLGQNWNDKWSTYLFYYGYNVEKGKGNDDAKPSEFGVGVSYKLNDYTTFGLNYMHADNDQDGNASREDNVVRFRTKVTF
ncbi:MAG: S-layer homology domain-containing protein [Synergistaceae bacterium]|nr:S-layer homology domain-containing protein [Synergistaceae bacterium]